MKIFNGKFRVGEKVNLKKIEDLEILITGEIISKEGIIRMTSEFDFSVSWMYLLKEGNFYRWVKEENLKIIG